MSELKVKKHITYTYETSDGREFDDKKEATEWQKSVNHFNEVCMLDHHYKPTKDFSYAQYIHIETQDQANAFNAVQIYFGYCSLVESTGFYRYDEIRDSYIEMEDEIAKLQHYIDMLKGGGQE